MGLSWSTRYRALASRLSLSTGHSSPTPFLPLVHATDPAQAFQLIVYHRRGYAGSSHLDAPVTLPQQAADCLALLHYLGIEQAHVAGHSLGGSIALQLALDAPETVGTLALMEPAMFVGETADSYRESLRQGAERVSQAGATAAVDGFLSARWTGYRAPLDRLVPGGFEQAVRDAGGQFTHEMPGLLDWHFGDDEARRVTQPTLSSTWRRQRSAWHPYSRMRTATCWRLYRT